jgi:hypothetical protein
VPFAVRYPEELLQDKRIAKDYGLDNESADLET